MTQTFGHHAARTVSDDRRSRLAESWGTSRLSKLPESIRVDMLEHAHERTLERGATVRWDRPIMLVLMTGRACVYISSTERLAAMRYLRPGDMTGLVLAFLPALNPTHLPLVIRATTECTVMELQPSRLANLAQADGAAAWQIGQWLAEDMVAGHNLLADEIFMTVRQLLARTLLDLSVQERNQRVVYATQQDLADAIGSVRAVVGRAVSELRNEGLVMREGRKLTLVDIDELKLLATSD